MSSSKLPLVMVFLSMLSYSLGRVVGVQVERERASYERIDEKINKLKELLTPNNAATPEVETFEDH